MRHLCSKVFAEARDIGCTIGVLHSTPRAYSLHESLGFERVADFRPYSTPSTLQVWLDVNAIRPQSADH